MTVFEFLKNYGVTLLVILVIAVAVITVIYQKRKGVLYQAALAAVSKAQEAWGSDMGKIKFAEVYAYIKSEYPIITFLVSEEQLTNLINEALDELKRIVLAKAEKQKKEVDYNDMDFLTQSIIQQTGNLEKFVSIAKTEENPG